MGNVPERRVASGLLVASRHNLYRYIGESMQGLLYLGYGFHFTLIICGIVLAHSLLRYDPALREVRQMTRIA